MMKGRMDTSGASPPPAPAPPVAVQRCFDLVLYLLQWIEKFHRAHKFTVGDRLAAAAMNVLEDLVAAAYSRDKRELLERAGCDAPPRTASRVLSRSAVLFRRVRTSGICRSTG